MERFIFVAAVTFAIIFGVVAMAGGSRHFHFDIDGMDGRTDPVMPVAAGHAVAQTFAGNQIEFKYLAAHVTLTPEDRQDFSIEINNPGRVPMPTVSLEGDHVVVDGHLANRLHHCGQNSADVRGYSDITTEQMPQIVVHSPRALHVSYSGAGLAEIGPAQSLDLDFNGCGAATAGDVSGQLKVNLAGSGRFHAGAAHDLDANVAGSGDIFTGAVADGAHLDIGGSGTITMASLNGALNSHGAGSGGVTISGGSVTTADIDLAGSGGVSVAAPIQTLKVSIVGSGDVNVNGAVGNVDASIAGSGGIHATSITGTVHKEIMGSGNVTTG